MYLAWKREAAYGQEIKAWGVNCRRASLCQAMDAWCWKETSQRKKRGTGEKRKSRRNSQYPIMAKSFKTNVKLIGSRKKENWTRNAQETMEYWA